MYEQMDDLHGKVERRGGLRTFPARAFFSLSFLHYRDRLSCLLASAVQGLIFELHATAAGVTERA